MNNFLIPILDYLKINPLAFINVIACFIVISYLIKTFEEVKVFFKKLDWKWYASLLTIIIVIYGEAILEVVNDKPPAYVVYLGVLLTILFGCLTVYYNANKIQLDSFKDIANENNINSLSLKVATESLKKQSEKLQTKISLARKMSMNTVTEVITVQTQVKDLKEQFTGLEGRFTGLEGRFTILEDNVQRIDTELTEFKEEVRNNFVHVDEQFSGINSQLAIITELLQNRPNQ